LSDDDIRNVIYLDELQEGSEEEQEKGDEEKKDIFLSEAELKNKLDSYRGRIPAIILKDLYEVLRGRKLTEDQLKRIIANVEKKLKDRGEVDVGELYAKIDRLEKTLQKLLRMQVRQAIMSSHEETSQSGLSSKTSEPEETVVGRGEEVSVDEDKKISDAIRDVFPTHDAGSVKKEEERITFLDRIPRSTGSMMFLLKWIEHLIERVGYSGLEDVLDYYVDIGWISEEVMFDVLKYAKGIRLYHENADWRPAGYMNVHDHLMSLLFIEALKTGRMNKEILHEVERQVYRIKKGVSEINGI